MLKKRKWIRIQKKKHTQQEKIKEDVTTLAIPHTTIVFLIKIYVADGNTPKWLQIYIENIDNYIENTKTI